MRFVALCSFAKDSVARRFFIKKLEGKEDTSGGSPTCKWRKITFYHTQRIDYSKIGLTCTTTTTTNSNSRGGLRGGGTLSKCQWPRAFGGPRRFFGPRGCLWRHVFRDRTARFCIGALGPHVLISNMNRVPFCVISCKRWLRMRKIAFQGF